MHRTKTFEVQSTETAVILSTQTIEMYRTKTHDMHSTGTLARQNTQTIDRCCTKRIAMQRTDTFFQDMYHPSVIFDKALLSKKAGLSHHGVFDRMPVSCDAPATVLVV